MCGSSALKAGRALRGQGAAPQALTLLGLPQEEEGFLGCGSAAVQGAGRGGLKLGFGLSWVGGERAEAPMGAAAGTEPPLSVKPQL